MEAKDQGLLNPSVNPDVMVMVVYGTVMALVFSASDGVLDGPVESVGRLAWNEIESVLRR